ncbi:IPExxxVDY family protein [Tunicatimonas pelagia]|uniref:IPExxxVDY family protein n=1 Tax=Tunicatimonas pelagia TaxID=931531 RepID=UPI0026666E42|nr:IPExxxVDY family protein [Tunicatimonas pelagia]WKN43698.1 IPExxxVDY family protein [Tunicatimonas pelagia]
MYTQLDTDFQYDFILFGLSSSSKEYKLAWALNQSCYCHFIKVPDITLNVTIDSVASFSHFCYQRGTQTWRLLRNEAFTENQEIALLLPELAQWNFLLRLDDPGNHISLRQLHQNLKITPDIKGFSQISVDLLPNKDNLLF